MPGRASQPQGAHLLPGDRRGDRRGALFTAKSGGQIKRAAVALAGPMVAARGGSTSSPLLRWRSFRTLTARGRAWPRQSTQAVSRESKTHVPRPARLHPYTPVRSSKWGKLRDLVAAILWAFPFSFVFQLVCCASSSFMLDEIISVTLRSSNSRHRPCACPVRSASPGAPGVRGPRDGRPSGPGHVQVAPGSHPGLPPRGRQRGAQERSLQNRFRGLC